MSHSITIELPDELYERLRKWTEAAHGSPAEYISRALENSLPGVSPHLTEQLQAELWAHRHRSDEELKSLVKEYLPAILHHAMQTARDFMGWIRSAGQAGVTVSPLLPLTNEIPISLLPQAGRRRVAVLR